VLNNLLRMPESATTAKTSIVCKNALAQCTKKTLGCRAYLINYENYKSFINHKKAVSAKMYMQEYR
jgi:hypothetical protein